MVLMEGDVKIFIVLEGIDKTGKTSLANFLSKKLNLPIKKFSQPKKHPYIEYMEFLLNDFEPCILDRFYLGERAYGPVKRGKSELSDKEIQNIEMTMKMSNPFLIYAHTSWGNIVQSFVKEKEEYTKVGEVTSLIQAYNKAIQDSMLKWNKFNYIKDKSYEKIYAKIRPWFEEQINNSIKTTALRKARVIGNQKAKILLVGDVCNTKLKENRDPNLVVPFAFGRSADYLYNALGTAGIKPDDIAITNFTKYHLNMLDSISTETICMCNLKKVVFLGKHKGPTFSTFKKEITLRHPSWAARFNYPIKKYAKELKEAIK